MHAYMQQQIRINFNGDDLSSDTELSLLKECIQKIGFDEVIERIFIINDSASFRFHADRDNLMQKIYQTIVGYFQEDNANELSMILYLISYLKRML